MRYLINVSIWRSKFHQQIFGDLLAQLQLRNEGVRREARELARILSWMSF